MTKRNNLSLIIPTYNRPRYLQRLLTYYENQKVGYEIVISDSSSDKNKEINKKIVSSFSNLNIHHLNHFSSETNFFHKIIQTTAFIDTQYSVFCADDDYIIMTAIDRCIAFLEKKQDFTAVGGYSFFFLIKIARGNQKKFYWKMYPASFSRILPYMSLVSSDPKIRLKTHLSFYFPTLYYVHRTSFIKKIFKEILPYIESFSFAESYGELSFDMLSVIHGKIKTLNIFYGARESVPIQRTTSSKYGGVSKTIMTGTFNDLYRKFRHCLIENLKQKTNNDIQASKTIIDEGMKLYLQFYAMNYPDSFGIKQIARSIIKPIHNIYLNLTQYKQLSCRNQINLRNWNCWNPPSKFQNDFINIRNNVFYTDNKKIKREK